MSFVGRVLAPRAEVIATSRQLQDVLLATQGVSDAGISVTPETAMRLGAVYACVLVISESMAQMPVMPYYRQADGGKTRATDHWSYELLHEQPNPWQTPFDFKAMLQAHVLLRGAGYAIQTVVGDEVRELLPVPPHRVTVEQLRPSYRLLFHVALPDGSTLDVPQDRMFYLPGLSLDGLTGISPIQYQRELIGIGLQMARTQAKLFSQGLLAGGVLQHPKVMSDEAYTRLKESFEEKYAGVDNAHKMILLEEGTQFNKIGLTLVEAQFMDAMKLNRAQVAALFRVPPHLIGDLDRATNNNIEQQSLDFLTYCLGPWITRWEERIRLQLLRAHQLPRDRRDLLVECIREVLLKADINARYTAYQRAILTGWMNRNEVRLRENLNPAPGLDAFLTPTNMGIGGDPTNGNRLDAGGQAA